MSANFENFDPLKVHDHQQIDESVQIKRLKRSIHSILHSYVGWYDPFAELIQNALDSVDKKHHEVEGFERAISIVINAESNSLTVSDNGIGLDKNAFERFLAPHESFKDPDERGSKGVGATFLAYGYNYIRIDTKTKQFSASGEMEGGRRWLHSENVASNPQVFPINSNSVDPDFSDYETGVSITIKFDKDTKPSTLTWPALNSAKSWFVALSVKTALGSIISRSDIAVSLVYIDKEGAKDTFERNEIGYFHPYLHLSRFKKYEDVIETLEKAIKNKGAGATLPNSICNLEAVYIDWNKDELIDHFTRLSDEDKQFIEDHNVKINASYMYGAGIWDALAKTLDYRRTAGIYNPGIQLAADNMPQGELIQIPLTRYTGRQNQALVVMHFENCTVDLGRKGFDKEFVDFAKSISSLIVQDTFSKVRNCLRSEDVKKTPLLQGDKVASWKKELESHEHDAPLILENENFFLPLNEISITSEPSREQDVIALFNQLVAGGVIRGIKVVGTNEIMTYDGAYRVRVGPNFDNHRFDVKTNPLGITSTKLDEFEQKVPDGFISSDLKVLEYKYSLDGLIMDITTGDKKASDIDLVVAWEVGDDYKKYFEIRTYLLEDALEDRDYHGVTHALHDEHGIHVMDAIILRDLISFLNDPNAEAKNQESYEVI